MSDMPPAGPTADEELWAALCHFSVLSLFFFPVPILVPLVIWLIKRQESSFVDYHGKESINFQISLLIYSVVASITCIGLVLLPVIFVANVVFVIIAGLAARNGEFYRYPWTIRLIK